jgi:hypothetical protein
MDMEWVLNAVHVVLFLLPIPFVLKRITASKKTIQSWPWSKLVLISLIVTGVAFAYSGLLAVLVPLIKANADSFFPYGFYSGLFLLAACTLVVLIRIAWIWLSGEDKE